ncbi:MULTISPECIES: branched-chain amino acid ABC transporter permease [unclassified Beijerinckia]|uniref:branched-chain amino acid ABC transporter permease n=1 Tax=unclassified Beijerinckia TaxID=2638183 RepID=UPI0008975A5F|nr:MULTISPECIES: branched-chain amino acid ABC transporter permease [unclassified Beijerinckia]MDH7797166.1 branched-chain amino acid transport system permease protein [Beijerinckia sp. GAS462]SEC74788.1 branched-chain amino acid transport system permease protein [Beijerinckia sp. 28-YEA-48]
MSAVLTVLFNGIAYGFLLFIMSVGLSVTLGMMNFVNLAQASFSMFGGYVMVMAMQSFGIPFLLTLPLVFVVIGVFSVVIERLVFRHFYNTDDLTQVLLTIGLVFMSIATATYLWGGSYQRIDMPPWLLGQREIFGLTLETYRIFLIVIGLAMALVLILGLERTRLGAMVRACVDNRRVAGACGLNTDLIFALTFAIGGGLAGLGGALSANLLGLDPNFPLRYLVYLLIIVSVGGMGTISGTLLAGIALGVADVMGKYYFPQFGGFVIYVLTVLCMLWRPQGLMGRKT